MNNSYTSFIWLVTFVLLYAAANQNNCIQVNNPSCELGSNEINMFIAKFVHAEWMLRDIFLNKLKRFACFVCQSSFALSEVNPTRKIHESIKSLTAEF